MAVKLEVTPALENSCPNSLVVALEVELDRPFGSLHPAGQMELAATAYCDDILEDALLAIAAVQL